MKQRVLLLVMLLPLYSCKTPLVPLYINEDTTGPPPTDSDVEIAVIDMVHWRRNRDAVYTGWNEVLQRATDKQLMSKE